MTRLVECMCVWGGGAIKGPSSEFSRPSLKLAVHKAYKAFHAELSLPFKVYGFISFQSDHHVPLCLGLLNVR